MKTTKLFGVFLLAPLAFLGLFLAAMALGQGAAIRTPPPAATPALPADAPATTPATGLPAAAPASTPRASSGRRSTSASSAYDYGRGTGSVNMTGPPGITSSGMGTSSGMMMGGMSYPDLEAAALAQEAQQAENETNGLLNQYASTTDEKERAKIKESLQKALEKQFDAQQKRRDREIAQVEARVKRLRELLDKRNQARGMILEKRLDQLIRDVEGLGWNAPSEPVGSGLGRSPYGMSSGYPAMTPN